MGSAAGRAAEKVRGPGRAGSSGAPIELPAGALTRADSYEASPQPVLHALEFSILAPNQLGNTSIPTSSSLLLHPA